MTVTVLGECVLCGEPVHHGNENKMPTTIGACHAECFRDECGERWFLVVEALAKRIQQLEAEHRLPTHLRTDFTQPAAVPSAEPEVELTPAEIRTRNYRQWGGASPTAPDPFDDPVR